jgi:leucyl aminopeptidase
MQINFQNETNQAPQTQLVLLTAGETLESNLEEIASQWGSTAAGLSGHFKANAGEQLLLLAGQRTAFLLGLGKKPTYANTLKTVRSFAHQQKSKLPPHIGVDLMYLPGDKAKQTEAIISGLLLSTLSTGQYREEAEAPHPFATPKAQLTLLAPEPDAGICKQAAERARHLSEAQLSIIGLVNAPSNKKTPAMLADWAVQSGQKHGYKVTVFDKPAIEELGLHALLAVNRGSEEPPRFIVMEYQPKKATGTLPKVGLVGKGVTFDTGGVSIKPSANMHYMKSDMGGAAAVFGTMEAAARLQLPVHLIGIVPATDNCVDANAVKPGDVIGSYSGKTIEVIDTDAEGRLILSDGIAYMLRHFAPDTLIDLATLTGSAVRTFGYHAGALFTNNNELEQHLKRASEATGERCWPLPLWEVYEEDLKSDVADVRNFSGRPMAGAINAAKFLEFFTENHPRWAHFDIAGVAFGDSEFTVQKSATGYGVRLLVNFLEQLKKA